MWLVLGLQKKATINVVGHTREIPFSDMADGCCGVLLAFETKADAAKYAGQGGEIIEMEEKTP